MKTPSIDPGLIIEALVHAPNFVTLQKFVIDIRENLTGIPRLTMDKLMKVADDTVVEWVRQADDARAISSLHNSTMTMHQWPTSGRGRAKIKDACVNRWKQLGVKCVP